MRILIALLTTLAVCQPVVAQSALSTDQVQTERSAHLSDFQVVEFRRYTIKDGERENFAQYFDMLNDLMTDSDNVMLLRPLTPERGIPILPAVDPIAEPNGAQGIVAAQIFALKANGVEEFAKQAEPTFASYRAAGVREAGVLVTLDVTNNFPQLPIRTDGPFLVWLGVLKDNQVLENDFTRLADSSSQSLSATGLLRAPPELVILTPTHRSRLRWLP
jgi:hypothetical protein